MGNIYFISNGNNVKIGYTDSDDIDRRLKTLQTGSTGPLALEGAITNTNRRDERELHHLFAEERVRGEWFRLSNRLKYFIELIGREVFVSKVHNKFIPSDLNKTLELIEKMLITRALKDYDNVQAKAAEMLGISRHLLHYKMKKYGL